MKSDMTPEEYLRRILTTGARDDCPMRRTLELLNGKWRTHVIYELCKYPSRRFGELKKALPRITNTMLDVYKRQPSGRSTLPTGTTSRTTCANRFSAISLTRSSEIR